MSQRSSPEIRSPVGRPRAPMSFGTALSGPDLHRLRREKQLLHRFTENVPKSGSVMGRTTRMKGGDGCSGFLSEVLLTGTFRDRDALSHSSPWRKHSFPEARSAVRSGENGNNRTAGGETEYQRVVSQSFWRMWRNDSTLSLFRHLSVGSGGRRPSRAGALSLIFHTKTK